MREPVADATQRFTNRVANYVRYRPGYPIEVWDILQNETGLGATSVVADLGSGTGLSAEGLLKLGCTVYGVEPNDAMREAAEDYLKSFPAFHSVKGNAEATTLPPESVTHVISAQAFHWFHPEKARIECQRILKPGGWVALIWNVRKLDSTPFLRDYEALLCEYGTDYAKVRHDEVGEDTLHAFFPNGHTKRTAPSAQYFDAPGLEGRLMSSSYAPAEGHPTHAPMLQELHRIFSKHQSDNQVAFEYDTEVYFGQVGDA